MVTLYFNPHSIYNQCVTKEDATAGLLAPSRGHSAQYRRIRTGCSGQWSWRSRRVLMEDPNYPQDAGSETENTERVSDISSRVNKHTTAANIRTDSRSALWSEHDTQWTRWLGLCFSCNPMMHCGQKHQHGERSLETFIRLICDQLGMLREDVWWRPAISWWLFVELVLSWRCHTAAGRHFTLELITHTHWWERSEKRKFHTNHWILLKVWII